MAITVRDIEEKKFRQVAFHGYKVDEVDDFLDAVGLELEGLHSEIGALKAQVAACQEKEKRITEMEQTLRDTLITAQRAAEDVMRASREKAAAMIADSELEGRRIMEDAVLQSQAATQRLEAVNRDVAGVKALIRRVIGEQLRLLEESYPDEPQDMPAAQQQVVKPGPVPALQASDFDRTQEFSVREVRELAGEEERAGMPRFRETFGK